MPRHKDTLDWQHYKILFDTDLYFLLWQLYCLDDCKSSHYLFYSWGYILLMLKHDFLKIESSDQIMKKGEKS